MLLLPTLLITIFLYRSIEHASTVKRSLLYTKKKKEEKQNNPRDPRYSLTITVLQFTDILLQVCPLYRMDPTPKDLVLLAVLYLGTYLYSIEKKLYSKLVAKALYIYTIRYGTIDPSLYRRRRRLVGLFSIKQSIR